MNKKQIKTAEKSLEKWLFEEYGQKPVKMECMHEFEMDGLTYCIFRFRKEKNGDAYIGVCGGFEGESKEHCGHVFGTFDDLYEEETALEMGRKMASFIREFQRREQAQAGIKAIFEQNLKYISKTEADVDKIARQFVKTETRFFLTVGNVDFPSGRVIVADPLCYLFGEHVIAPVLKRRIPCGSYPVEVSICRNENVGIRMCTARLKIKGTKAVRYELAESEEDSAAFKASDGVMHGFPVDAGMMCFIDADAAENYAVFLDKWHKENPGKNHYDDYFAAFFAESDKKLPAYQREGGDFIEWTNPDTNERMVQISSGFGDGFYQSFWGFDESGEVCELIVPMVDPDIFDN